MTWNRILVVLNPVAGTTDPRDVRGVVERMFAHRSSTSYSLYETAEADDVTEIVRRRLAEGFDVVVASGGDGTVSSVAAALIGTDIPMAILPAGTANVFARDLRIPSDLSAAAALLDDEPRLRAVDVMQRGQTSFLLNVGVGLTARMMRRADRDAKSQLGFFAYVLAGLGTLRNARRRRFRIIADGNSHVFSAVEVFVVNCPALGVPHVRIGDGIRVDDGRIDVFVFRPKRLTDYLRIAGSILFSRERENSHITHLSVEDTVIIECHEALPVQGDGDVIASAPLTIRVRPRAVRILVPEQGS